MYKIVNAECLADKIYLMDVEAPRVARACQPGEFVIVKMDEVGERIPLTICDFDREKGLVTIVFQIVGASTMRMAELKAGDYFQDFVGPLGQPSEFVKEDLEEVLILKNKDRGYIDKEVKRVSKLLDIEHLLEHHPYDLSGGELQKAGMAKVMLLNPKIILLDEPTKGLDAYCKEEIGKMLLKLRDTGVTIVVVSHDIEFSARYSDRCAMFFD